MNLLQSNPCVDKNIVHHSYAKLDATKMHHTTNAAFSKFVAARIYSGLQVRLLTIYERHLFCMCMNASILVMAENGTNVFLFVYWHLRVDGTCLISEAMLARPLAD